MGNEHSSNEHTEEKGLGKHTNGGVNGLSVTISSNGLDVTSNTIGTQQNGEPPSLMSNKESNEGDCVIIEPESQIAEAQVISGSPGSPDQKNIESDSLDSESHVTSENHKSTAQEEPQEKKEKKVKFFGNIFKKTKEPPSRECDIKQDESSTVDQIDAGAPITDSQFIAEAQVISGSPGSTDQKNVESDSLDSESHVTSENHKSTAQEEPQEKKEKKVTFFGNIFKKTKEPPSRECDIEQDESSTVDQTDAVTSNTIGTQQNDEPPSLMSNKESNEGDCVIIEPESQIAEAQVISRSPGSTDLKNIESDSLDSESHITSENHKSKAQEKPQEKKEKKITFFGNIFKKTKEPPSRECDIEQDESSTVDQTDAGAPVSDSQFEAADINQDSETFKEPESVSLDPSPEEGETQDTGKENTQLVEDEEESHTEENPVMNFFKTLVKPTKTPKTETTTPDATKDQLQKETQPAAAPTTSTAQVADPPAAPKGMSIPPPPPPAPPTMEIKGEIAAKPITASPKAEPKAAVKESKATKGTFSVDTLTRFFRPKALLGKRSKAKGVSASGANVPAKTASGEVEEVLQPVVEAQPVEAEKPVEEAAELLVEIPTTEEEPLPDVEVQKADASKASTLEAAAKPEVAPTVQEDKKTPSKPFFSFFKPKVLLNQMATKVSAASTSGVQLLRKTTGVAAEPKKKDTPPPPVAAEAAQAVKAKEDPKAPEAPADKSGPSQGGDESANVPRKLEKRNSIHLFFKNLSQKRNSTDAGVQTEQVTTAPAAEKAK